MDKRLRLITYMTSRPVWHYGPDLASISGIWRGVIYIHLGKLEEAGVIESREEPTPMSGCLPRIQYRTKLAWRGDSATSSLSTEEK